MTFKPEPGVTLAASAAIRDPAHQTFTRAQVAYLIALAYTTGRRQSLYEDLSDVAGSWVGFADPATMRQRRIAARLAAYGPSTYQGGPVDWETGRGAA